jgi:dephospho-CoA kinase
MLRVGLTGGIATGKTTVASLLRDCDVPVLNADTIGHELLEPGQEAYDEIVAVFDEDILDADGKVNRAKLGGVIFADAQKRARLNQILHPRILEIVQEWFAALDEPDGPEFAVVEAALIFEARYNQRLDKIIVCWCLPEQQMERLTLRGLSVEEAQQRIAAQMPLSDKRKLADESIDCSGSIEETQRQVNQVAEKLKLSGSGRNIP